jgi:addiction module RelE/StbE family toxin
MSYKVGRTQEFKDQFRKLTKKDKPLQDKLDKKIRQILDNPYIGKPKSHNLKYTRGTHVNPYVIIYMIINDTISFLYVDHHDFVYKDAPKVLGNIERQFPELWAVMSPDLRRHLKQ